MTQGTRFIYTVDSMLFLGGAGGKHTWGAYGSEMTADNAALDYKDPNYDPESTENGDITLEAIIPEMSDDEIYVSVSVALLFCQFMNSSIYHTFFAGFLRTMSNQRFW